MISRCGKPCEIYSRITGYYRPLKYWNIGKQEEFRERRTFDVQGGIPKNEKSNEENSSSN